MNQGLKGLIIFVSGACIGAGSMYLGVKKYFELKADIEIDEMKALYEDKLSEVEDLKSSLEGDLEGPKELPSDAPGYDRSKPLTHKEIIEKMNNKPDLEDYTKYFKAKGEKIDGVSETLRDAKEEAEKSALSDEEMKKREEMYAEAEGPEDDEPYTDEEDDLQTRDYENATRDAKDPYEIDPSDYELTCGDYEKISVKYYVSDDIVADEEDDEVDNYRLLIGDVIESSGFDEDDRDILFVRNDKLLCDFEIAKTYEKYIKL